jgi:trehalose-6-phosphate synthase
MPTLINFSNRLPVTVEGEKITKSSGGLVAALEGLSEREYTTAISSGIQAVEARATIENQLWE